jgi:hypothetical protein
VNKEAERLAARILCQWPDIDLDDVDWFRLGRDVGFKWDLFSQRSCYGKENVKQEAQFLRHLAEIANKAWTVEALHRDAQRLYDPEYRPEEQSHDFYVAQALYQLVKVIHGHQSQQKNAVA